MGERGKDRPVWKAKGTSYTFQWPMGASIAERRRLTDIARQETDGEPISMMLWLQRNAWRNLIK